MLLAYKLLLLGLGVSLFIAVISGAGLVDFLGEVLGVLLEAGNSVRNGNNMFDILVLFLLLFGFVLH